MTRTMTNEGKMNTVSLAEAKAKLSEILNQVEVPL